MPHVNACTEPPEAVVTHAPLFYEKTNGLLHKLQKNIKQYIIIKVYLEMIGKQKIKQNVFFIHMYTYECTPLSLSLSLYQMVQQTAPKKASYSNKV